MGTCGIHTGLVGNDPGLQAPSLLEQLLEAGQDTPKTLKRCEIVCVVNRVELPVR